MSNWNSNINKIFNSVTPTEQPIKLLGFAISRKQAITVGLLIAGMAIAGFLIAWQTGALGGEIVGGMDLAILEFIKPPPPPPEQAEGLCKVLFYHYLAGDYVDSPNGVQLYYYDNETYYGTVGINSTFLLNASSIAVVNVSGYYYASGTLFGSGSTTGEPQINYFPARMIASRDNLSLSVVSIDGNTSLNYVSNITDGFHIVQFSVINLNYTYNQTTFGSGMWMPYDSLPTIAKANNVSYISHWLTINGTIDNAQYRRYGSSTFQDLVWRQPYSWANSTYIYEVVSEYNFFVSGYWYGINGIRISDLFLDNVTDRYVEFNFA